MSTGQLDVLLYCDQNSKPQLAFSVRKSAKNDKITLIVAVPKLQKIEEKFPLKNQILINHDMSFHRRTSPSRKSHTQSKSIKEIHN